MFAGGVFLAIGLLLFAVDSFVLSSNATSALSSWTGPPSHSPQAMVRQMAVEITSHRHTVTPPDWLRWMVLCTGSVLLTHAALLKWHK